MILFEANITGCTVFHYSQIRKSLYDQFDPYTVQIAAGYTNIWLSCWIH